MIKRIDHIGIAVNNMDEALAFFRDALGLDLSHIGQETGQKSEVAFMPVGGSEVELVSPLADDSPMSKFLAKRGEGIHHIAFEVDDIEAELARLKDKGVQLINETAYVTSEGKRAAFIHPKAAHGVLIELYQLG